MATADEIKLGRLAVNRGYLSQEQVLAVLRVRNAAPEGPTLGALLVERGLLSQEQLAELRSSLLRGEEARDRREVSTEREISLAGPREMIARACLEEALAALGRDREGALKELARLASEFGDTESGNKALVHLKVEQGRA